MKDIVFNFDTGTIFKNGDLNIDVCEEQSKRLLIVTDKGGLKEFPASCIGAGYFLENEDVYGFLRETRSEFIADGMQVDSIQYADGKLTTSAKYTGNPINKKLSTAQNLVPNSDNKNAKAIAGQTWVDLTLQELGDEGRIFELCDANNAGITDDVPASTSITSLLVDSDKISIVKILQQRNPSSIYVGVGNPSPGGIELWAIEIDFIVT